MTQPTQPTSVHNAYKITALTGAVLTGLLGGRLVMRSVKNTLAFITMGLLTDASLQAGKTPGLKTPTDYFKAVGARLQDSTIPNTYNAVMKGIKAFEKYDQKSHFTEITKQKITNVVQDDQKILQALIDTNKK